jgi:hypothetical protein
MGGQDWDGSREHGWQARASECSAYRTISRKPIDARLLSPSPRGRGIKGEGERPMPKGNRLGRGEGRPALRSAPLTAVVLSTKEDEGERWPAGLAQAPARVTHGVGGLCIARPTIALPPPFVLLRRGLEIICGARRYCIRNIALALITTMPRRRRTKGGLVDLVDLHTGNHCGYRLPTNIRDECNPIHEQELARWQETHPMPSVWGMPN